MPKVKVLPHQALCPAGAEFDVDEGRLLIEALLANGIAIEHACEGCGACSTCHTIIREVEVESQLRVLRKVARGRASMMMPHTAA